MTTALSSKPKSRRRKWLRIGLWTLGVLLLIPVLAWVGAAAYLYSNKEKVLADVLAELNRNLGGQLKVSRMEPTLLGDFPNVSIALYDVSLRDSLWDQHHRDLLSMKRVYVKVSPMSMLKGSLQVNHVRLADGSFDLFTDSTGYSNGYLLKSKDTSKKTRREGPDIRRALVENVRVTIDVVPKDKLFKMHVRSLSLRMRDRGETEALTLKMEIDIDGLGFNLDRGSFAKNKLLKTSLDIAFNKKTRMINIPLQDLEFNNSDIIKMAAQVYVGPKPKSYSLRFVAPEIMLDSGATFLAENVSSKLALVRLREPVYVEAKIRGGFAERNPLVHVSFKVEDDVLSTPAGDFKECSFTGFFDNEYVHGMERTDPNSVIEVNDFKGTYEGIAVIADTMAIRDLKNPRLHAMIRSKFDATAINNLTGGKTFRFSKGQADFNLRYDGSLSLIDGVVPALYGTVNIRGAEGTYTPRGLPLSGINASLVFKGVDVQFPRVAFSTGSSAIQMSGIATNLLGALHRPEVPASLRWSVTSPKVDLADFLPFLQKRGVAVRPKAVGHTPLADRLDDVLDRADAHLTTSIGALEYQKFHAEAVRADVTLTRTHARIQNASLRHAGGTIQVTGEAEQGEAGGPFKMNALVRDVNVNSLFTTFDNFGQDALTSANIRGIVSFEADLTGRLGAGGSLQQQSLAGKLDFTVRKGALVSFAPLEKVARYVFRGRNLSDLRFEVLKARFILANEKIQIEPMEVRSSALSLNLVGTYGLKSGTDISFQIPLRNPKKDSVDLAQEADFEAGDKGIVIHLRAQNPTGQKLDIGWDKRGKVYKQRVGGQSVEPSTEQSAETEENAETPSRKERRQERRRTKRG